MGLLRVLPLKDQRLLRDLGKAHQVSRSVTYLYGSIPKSKEALMQRFLDRSVSQSMVMAGQIHDYTSRQERTYAPPTCSLLTRLGNFLKLPAEGVLP